VGHRARQGQPHWRPLAHPGERRRVRPLPARHPGARGRVPRAARAEPVKSNETARS
jgi:hypothetical protein